VLALSLGVAVALGALWLAIGSGSPDPKVVAIERAVRDLEKAVRESDVEAFQAVTTDAYFVRRLSSAGPASQTSPEDPQLALGQRVQRRIDNVTIAGDTATVLATIGGADAQNVDAVEVRLVRRDGAWLVDHTGMRKTTPRGGAQVIDVTMGDFSFKPEPLVIKPGGAVVIRARNTGGQPHLVGIWLVPKEHELIKLIEATDFMPPGVERIVQSQVFAVGDEGDITLRKGLKRGRYMLTCFLSDVTSPVLTPHYDLGMLAEFEVK
jgi:hypothetical protein